MTKIYNLINGDYIEISKNDNGYEYSIYKKDGKLKDGGLLENSEFSYSDAYNEIVKMHDLPISLLL